ncbi:MAG TPA: hypothetical protein VIH90_04490 [Candidatus Saccharimonadales bacterium]
MSSHEGNTTTAETESIERLRRILESEQQRQIAYEEAFEVAQLLINFYDSLADNTLGLGQELGTEGEYGN